MKIERCCTKPRRGKAALLACLAGSLVLAPPASAEAPEWLRGAARLTLPGYAEKTDAVILLDEQETRVKDSGEIRTTRRLAYKILRPEGRHHASFVVAFDQDTNVSFLKAWSIFGGREEEVKEKDAVETGVSAETLYSDVRRKIITAPSAEPGAVVGYEYEQKRRPTVLQDVWWMQDPHPVRRARFLLQLPRGWEYRAAWLHHPGLEARATGENEWTWEVQNVPAIESEPSMPAWGALAARLAVTYFPREGAEGRGTWAAVGQWYAKLAAGVREATPEIHQKVAELTAGKSSLLDKIRPLAGFAQRDVRYVSIQIGVGGYRPHAAGLIIRNRYGDCKDKVTLLSTMLKEVGLESYFVLVHSQRGAVSPQFPSMLNFNHAILAIRLPPDLESGPLFSLQNHKSLGPLLFFDPTDEFTPLGYLPPDLQGSHGLLVTDRSGELVELPPLPAAANRLVRNANVLLNSEGSMAGSMQEIYWGAPAATWRATYLATENLQRQRFLQDRFTSTLAGAALERAEAENLQDIHSNLVLRFHLKVDSYAQKAGDLLLVRPRIMGWKGESLGDEGQERKLPFAFETNTLHTDVFEIMLPDNYIVDELPDPVEAVFDFGEYRSRAVVEGKVLRYTRSYMVKSLEVPLERFGELRRFFAIIASDQRAQAVLKRSAR
jgi:hypothetical protein